MGNEEERGPWSDEETRVLVDAYFSMLALELAGERYSKIEHNRLVQEATGRSKGSIEFKFCNASHVLWELGLPYVDGYKPRSHVQESLRSAIRQAIDAQPARVAWSDHVAHAGVPRDMPSEPEGSAVADAVGDARSLYEVLGGLWDRATGGTDVAARPDHVAVSVWPAALRPAGVEEACDWFTSGLTKKGLPRLLFLIGGPGAGKSHATSSIVSDLRIVSQHDDGLAHRSYRYAADAADVLIVNDATIGDDRGSKAPLATDINDVVGAPDGRSIHLMACVNRGILVEEWSALLDHRSLEAPDSAGAAVIGWLDNVPSTDVIWEIQNVESAQFIRSGTLMEFGQPRANVVAVYVDECSLFEPRPAVSLEDNRVRAIGKYAVTRIEDRSTMDLTRTPAHDLITRVMDRVDGLQKPARIFADPLAANAEMLRDVQIRANVLTIARSAELASGIRFTYRELWGLIVRCLVGDAPRRASRDQLSAYVEALQPTGESKLADFEGWKSLAALRGFQAMYGAREDWNESATRQDPVLRVTTIVDPVRDALPGDAPEDPARGWSDAINEAFTSHYSESSPLAILRSRDPSGRLTSVIQEFDEGLDRAYVELLGDSSVKEKDRTAAISWYGSYLMRMYATAYGITAFRREISVLLDAILYAPNIPDVLEPTLRTLIRPQRTPGSGADVSLLPLYDSRAEPIAERLDSPKLAIVISGLEMRTERLGGEQVMLVLRRNDKEMGRMALDFPLIREALACVDGYSGVTNLVASTAPRLERIRAVHLKSSMLDDATVRMVNGRDSLLVRVNP
jgi:hypothetical protein